MVGVWQAGARGFWARLIIKATGRLSALPALNGDSGLSCKTSSGAYDILRSSRCLERS